MTPGRFRFGSFVLDGPSRRLTDGAGPVALNARYFDALALLVHDHGKLITKDRFLEEVWRGVPVTDEALTQCVRTLRRQLGDEAARPRFIETVPKHGYRFIAPVTAEDGEAAPAAAMLTPSLAQDIAFAGAMGTFGAAVAGLIGGAIYGFAASSLPSLPGSGAVSVVFVLAIATLLVALLGGAGVAFGIAASGWHRSPWMILGGAAGGLVVGACVKLLGLDTFDLLFGHAPRGITGAAEGATLGAGVGLAALLVGRAELSSRVSALVAAVCGAAAGLAIALMGGRLMAGSLDLLVRSMPGSRLSLEPIGTLFGERGFGPVSLMATSALEAALFSAGIVSAMTLDRRRLAPTRRES